MAGATQVATGLDPGLSKLTLRAFDAVGEDRREALEADLLVLIGRFNRADDGTMVVPSEYLDAVIVRR